MKVIRFNDFITRDNLVDIQFYRECKNEKELKIIGDAPINCERLFSNTLGTFSKLEVIDLSEFNMSKAQYVERLFDGCRNLKEIRGLENLDTSNFRNIRGLFLYCESLESLDLSNWKLDKLYDMNNAFEMCLNLKEIKGLENFNLSEVDTLSGVFKFCKSLKNVKGIENWNVSNIRDADCLFMNCESLENVDLSNWKTDNLKKMSCLFKNCNHLKSVDLRGWNTGSVFGMSGTFNGCENLREIKGLNDLDVSKVFSVMKLFKNCKSLENVDISNWQNNNFKYMDCMFEGCKNLTKIKGIENLKILDKNRGTDYIFKDCPMDEKVKNTLEEAIKSLTNEVDDIDLD